MRTPPRWNPDYQRNDYTPIEPPESESATPDVTVSERRDKVLYGPRGDVIKRFEDRPFRGYKGDRPQ